MRIELILMGRDCRRIFPAESLDMFGGPMIVAYGIL